MGTALHVMLVDSTTGVLVEQKIFGLKNSFSNSFIDLLEQQSSRLPDDWRMKVQRVYARYTSDQLARLAKLRNE